MNELTKAEASIWMDSVFKGWREKNINRIVEIFQSCKHYMEDPFYPIATSPVEIRKLWAEIELQENINLDYSIINISNNIVTYRWKCNFVVNGDLAELDGIYVVEFGSDSQCLKFEQWTVEKE